jgi:hypothetical protein
MPGTITRYAFSRGRTSAGDEPGDVLLDYPLED